MRVPLFLCLALATQAGMAGSEEMPGPAPAPPPTAAPADTPQAAPPATIVAAKTPIELELLQNLNSLLDRTGEIVRFRVVDDVKVGDRVVVAGGTLVEGRIKYAERSRTNGRAGVLQVVVQRVTAVDGTRLPLWGEMVASGRNRSKASAVTQIAVGVLGFGVHGKEAAHVIGDRFTVSTRGEVSLGPEVSNPAADARSAIGAPSPAPEPSWMFEAEAAPSSITYEVFSGGLPESLRIEIPRHDGFGTIGPDTVAMVRLDGRPLDPPIRPARVEERRKGWTAVFDCWTIVRHIEGTPEGRTHEAGLRIDLPAGQAALVRSGLTLTLQ